MDTNTKERMGFEDVNQSSNMVIRCMNITNDKALTKADRFWYKQTQHPLVFSNLSHGVSMSSMSQIQSEMNEQPTTEIVMVTFFERVDKKCDPFNPRIRTLNQLVMNPTSLRLSRSIREIWIACRNPVEGDQEGLRRWLDRTIFAPSIEVINRFMNDLKIHFCDYLPIVLLELLSEYVMSRRLDYQLYDLTEMNEDDLDKFAPGLVK
jgi:hypothetical protein